MERFLAYLIFTCLLSGAIVFADEPQKHSFKPKDGFVPDGKTAMQIAESVWIPIYGEDKIRNEKPFNAELMNGVWTVTGSLPKRFVGGVALVEISRVDGCILRVSHGK